MCGVIKFYVNILIRSECWSARFFLSFGSSFTLNSHVREGVYEPWSIDPSKCTQPSGHPSPIGSWPPILQFIFQIDVTVVSSITGRITHTPLSSVDVKFLKKSALEDKLADTIITSAEVFQVDMLIGNDYYFDLPLQPRKNRSRK